MRKGAAHDCNSCFCSLFCQVMSWAGSKSCTVSSGSHCLNGQTLSFTVLVCNLLTNGYHGSSSFLDVLCSLKKVTSVLPVMLGASIISHDFTSHFVNWNYRGDSLKSLLMSKLVLRYTTGKTRFFLDAALLSYSEWRKSFAFCLRQPTDQVCDVTHPWEPTALNSVALTNYSICVIVNRLFLLRWEIKTAFRVGFLLAS